MGIAILFNDFSQILFENDILSANHFDKITNYCLP